jgi:RNA polymerase sigma factor (sigma-70 family)
MTQPPALLLRYLRRLAPPPADTSDVTLLRQYAEGQDGEAFAELVRRHGPMVWAVCRRTLGNDDDADDAFQATFLALARQASKLRRPEALAAWLHGVARRVALKARAARDRRRRHEWAAARPLAPDPLDEMTARELLTVLDEELARLPEAYRLPLILCGLQGRTVEEVARQLAWKPGSVKGRLERGRARLAARLARRGIAPSAAAAATMLAPAPASASALPARLLALAGQAAEPGAVPATVAALADATLAGAGVAKAHLAVLLTLGLIGAGAGVLFQGSLGPAGDPAPPPPARPAAAPAARADVFGDALPPRARARLGTVRLRLGGLVYACAFSPDGKTLAAGSADHTVHVFDAATGRPLRRFAEHHFDVTALAFSADGRVIASGSGDGVLCLREATTGNKLHYLVAHPGVVWSLAFAADGKTLVSGGQDKLVRLWDPAAGKELRKFEGHEGPVRSVALSRDGRTVASGGEDKTVRLWEAATGKLIRKLEGPKEEVECTALSPDGTLVAAGSRDMTVWLWEAGAGKLRRRLPPEAEAPRDPGGDVWAVAFAPDGKTLACGSAFHTLRLWDVATGTKLRQLDGPQRTTYSGWHHGGIPCLAFAPDGRTLAFGQDNMLRLWDFAAWTEKLQFEGHRAAVRHVFLSADGQSLVTASDEQTRNFLRWDLASGKAPRVLPGAVTWAHIVDLSPDQKILAAQQPGQVLGLWDTATGRDVRRIKLPKQDVSHSLNAVAFSADGRLVAASGFEDNSIRVWETATGKETQILEGHPDYCRLAFSPDARRLASCGLDRQIRVHDLTTGRTARQFDSGGGSAASWLAFSPDGTLLASTGEYQPVRLWDPASGHLVRQFGEQPGLNTLTVAFSPGGWMLAGGGADGTIRLWEVVTGRERRRLPGHHGPVHSVAFSADGRTLASGSADTTALTWDVYGSGPFREPNALWDELASADATRAYDALCTLAHSPQQALPVLKEHLRPARPAEPQRVARLLEELDSDAFSVRQKAMTELEQLGEDAEPGLRKALAGGSSLEVRRRVERLLAKLEPHASPARLRVRRALEVLEQSDAPEARRLLEALARGEPDCWLTQRAKASLERLARLPIAP